MLEIRVFRNFLSKENAHFARMCTGYGLKVIKRLLINAANAFEMADIKGILRNQIAGRRCFNFVWIAFPLTFGAFKGGQLGFGVNNTFFSSPIFKR